MILFRRRHLGHALLSYSFGMEMNEGSLRTELTLVVKRSFRAGGGFAENFLKGGGGLEHGTTVFLLKRIWHGDIPLLRAFLREE